MVREVGGWQEKRKEKRSARQNKNNAKRGYHLILYIVYIMSQKKKREKRQGDYYAPKEQRQQLDKAAVALFSTVCLPLVVQRKLSAKKEIPTVLSQRTTLLLIEKLIIHFTGRCFYKKKTIIKQY